MQWPISNQTEAFDINHFKLATIKVVEWSHEYSDFDVLQYNY